MPYGNDGGAATLGRAVGPCGRWRRAAALGLAAVGLATLGVSPARLAAQAPTDPFAGVTVSDSQRVVLQALGARTRAAVGPLLGRFQKATSADSVAVRATYDSLRAIYTAHNAATRALLTAEQRAVFDGNVRAIAAAHAAATRARDRQRTLTALIPAVTTSTTPVSVTPVIGPPPAVAPPAVAPAPATPAASTPATTTRGRP